MMRVKRRFLISLLVLAAPCAGCRSLSPSESSGSAEEAEDDNLLGPKYIPFISDFRVSPWIAQPGDPVTLFWDVQNAKEISILVLDANQSPIASGGLMIPTYYDAKRRMELPQPRGTVTIAPPRTATYVLRVEGFNNQVINRSIQAQVENSPGAPFLQYFISNDAVVRRGQYTTLRWKAQGCSLVRIRGGSSVIDRECLLGPDSVNVKVVDSTFYEIQLINSKGEIVGTDTIKVEVYADPAPANVVRFEPTTYAVNAGEPVTLKWAVQNAKKVRLAYDPSFGSNPNAVENLPNEGSIEAKPLQDTAYTLIAESSGTEAPVSKSLRVSVNQKPRIARFFAQPPMLRAGQEAVLQWEVTNCKTAVITTPETKLVPCAGSLAVRPTQRSNYSLLAEGMSGGVDAATISIAVLPDPAEKAKINHFYASSSHIVRGQQVTLFWETQDASKVEIVGNDGGMVTAKGERRVKPLRKQPSYILKAYGKTGEVEAEQNLVINVVPPSPQVLFFRATPSVSIDGKPITLEWKATACEHVKIFASDGEKTTQECTGRLTFVPKKTTAYQMVVIGKNGESTSTTVSVAVGHGSSDQEALDTLNNLLKKN